MEIKKEFNNGRLVISISGKLDTVTSPLLEEELKDLSNVKELIFDCNDLIYISSSGLRLILKTYKIMNNQGSMKLINVCSLVKEILDITGFSDVIDIELA
jgi:anti-sigma B factor antagonist